MKSILALIFIISCSGVMFSGCQKEISRETGNGPDTAQGTLKDSLGSCLPSTVFGTYYNGITPGSDTCFVEIQVNVTQTGSYNIFTDLQNGFQFVDSGFFNTTGINTIRLRPIGTPILANGTPFTITFDSSSCPLLVNVKDSTGTGLGGTDTTGSGGGSSGDTTSFNTWKFTDSTNGVTYSGVFYDPGAILSSGSFGPILAILGFNNLVALDTSFSISVEMPSLQVQTGTYYTNVSDATTFGLGDATGTVFYYTATGTTTQVIKVNVTSFDSTTRIIKGNFSGTALYNSTTTVYITHGAFNTLVQ